MPNLTVAENVVLGGGARARHEDELAGHVAGAKNLPELNLEHPAVRDHLYARPDSVVRSYLREGVDGWRLDVAHDIGFRRLEELTQRTRCNTDFMGALYCSPRIHHRAREG